MLPDVDRGGVEGKYDWSMSVSSMIVGFWRVSGRGDPVGVITEGPLL